jgi:hypothetical protein
MNSSQVVALHGLLQSIFDGYQNAVASADITAHNAQCIMKLQARELMALIQSNSSFIKFKIDNEVLGLLLNEIAHRRTELQPAQKLIELDAPLDMIRHFYPEIPRTQYGLQRRLSGLNTTPQSRSRSPDESQEMAISTAWFKQVKDQDNPTPEDYLNILKESKAPVRQIWAMYKPKNHGEQK